MITFLIPPDYEQWLPADQPDASAALRNALHHLPNNNLLQLTKKRFGTKTVYTFNVDIFGRHRLIFEKVRLMPQDKKAYVLRGIALHHHYTPALKWKPYVTLDETVLQKQKVIAYHQPVLEEEEARPAYLYAGQWIYLTLTQEEILIRAQLPHIVTGPPGSGKTLVSEAFFQEKALQHITQPLDRDVLKLLYVSPTAKLNQAFEQAWTSWVDVSLSPEEKAKIHLTCMTFDELAQRADRPSISKEDILPEITNYLRTRKGIILSAETILEELYLSAYVLDEDVSAQKTFDTSSIYKTLGITQSSVPPEQRQAVYEIYQTLLKKFNANLPGLTVNRLLQPQYDYTCADEIQSARVLDLLHARAVTHDNNVLYCGDNYQRGAEVLSSSTLLVPYLYKTGGLKIERTTLLKTYRLMPSVAQVCHELVVLMNVLQEGKTDKADYSQITSALEETRLTINWVDKDNMVDFDALGHDATIAALVLNERDLHALQTKSRMDNIFTVEQIRGLQFAKVVMYLSKETLGAFRSVNRKMQDKKIQPGQLLPVMEHGTTRKEQPDHKDFKLLSDLMTALSRACGEVWVYPEFESLDKKDQEQIALFVSWLRALCQGREGLMSQASTPMEWLVLIHQLIDLGSEEPASGVFERAYAHLSKQFGLSAEAGKKYSGCYKQNKLSPENGLKKIEKMQQEAAHAETSGVLRHEAEKPQPTKSLSIQQAPAPSEDIPECVKRLIEAKNPLNLKNVCEWVYQVLQLGPASVERYLFGSSRVFENLFLNPQFVKTFECYLGDKNEESLKALLPFIHNKIPGQAITYFQALMLIMPCHDNLGKYFELIQVAFYQATIEELNEPLKTPKAPIDLSLLYVLFTHKDGPSLMCANPKMIKQKITSKGLNRKIENMRNLLYQIFCIESYANIWHYLIPFINKKGMACTCESGPALKGVTPLFILCKKEKGVQFLLNNLHSLIEKIDISLFHKPITEEGKLQGITPFLLLIKNMDSSALSNEFKLFKENWDYFKKVFTSEAFNHCVTGEGRNTGVDLLYVLCSRQIGIELLTDYWDDFQKVMNPELFNQPVANEGGSKGESSLLALFSHKKGIKLLSEHWDYFNPILIKAGMQEEDCQKCSEIISAGEVQKEMLQKLAFLNLNKLASMHMPEESAPSKTVGPIRRPQ